MGAVLRAGGRGRGGPEPPPGLLGAEERLPEEDQRPPALPPAGRPQRRPRRLLPRRPLRHQVEPPQGGVVQGGDKLHQGGLHFLNQHIRRNDETC